MCDGDEDCDGGDDENENFCGELLYAVSSKYLRVKAHSKVLIFHSKFSSLSIHEITPGYLECENVNKTGTLRCSQIFLWS